MSATALPPVSPTPSPLVAPVAPVAAPLAASGGPGSFSRLLEAADARRQAERPEPTQADNAPAPGPQTPPRTPGAAQKAPARDAARPERSEARAAGETKDTATERDAATTTPAEVPADAQAADAPADAASMLAGLGLLTRPLPPAEAALARGRGAGRDLPDTAAGRTGAAGGSAAAAWGALGAEAAADPAGAAAGSAAGKAFASLVAAAQAADARTDHRGEAGAAALRTDTPAAAPTAELRPLDAAALGALAQAGAAPGSAALGASPATPAEARLPTPPGQPGFAEQLGSQLTAFVRDGVQHARLQLHPLELGPVTVQIQLDGGSAHMSFAAEHAQTRQALEQALPTLAGSLREAGLTLSGGGVFEQPQQPQPDGNAGGRGERGRGAGGREAGDDAAGGAVNTAPRRRGVVDLVA